MKVVVKRRFAVLLALILTMTSVLPAFAAKGRGTVQNDMAGHWAEDDLLIMKNNGIMGGYPDGSMKPNRYVTIAETVKIINKAFQIDGSGDVYGIPYSDVKTHEWYSNDIALASENGYLRAVAPGKQLKPNSPATREQVGAMLAQIMGLELKSLDSVTKYSDYGKITGGYQYYFAAAVKEGFFVGYPDNTVRPKSTVTRGIIAAVTNRALANSAQVELHPIFVGPNDILVEAPGTLVKDSIVDNLWISESVGEGTVTLENVRVRGKLVIKGGGPNSVIIKGDSQVPLVYMEKESKDLRLKVEKPAIVGNVNINAGSRNYITGEIDTLIQNVKAGEVKIEKATIKTVEIQGESTDLYTDKNSTITTINVKKKAADTYMYLDGKITSVTIAAPFVKSQVYGDVNNISIESTGKASEVIAEKGSKITTVKTDASRVAIRGKGIVENAIINGNDCKVDTVPTRIEVDKNATGTTSNGKDVAGGTNGTTTPDGNIDGNNGATNPNAKVNAMEITKYPAAEKLVYTVGSTLDLSGLEVTIKYEDGKTKNIPLKDFNTNSITINPNPDGQTKVLASTKDVKITHTPSKKTISLSITVNPIPKVKEMMIAASPKTNYVDGEVLDLAGMEVLLKFDNEITKTIAFAKTTNAEGKPSDTFKDLGIETSIPNGTQLILKIPGTVPETKAVSISFRNFGNQIVKTPDPLYININPVARINALSASGYKYSYLYGDKFDFTNLEVKLVSSNPDESNKELRYIPALKEFVVKKQNTGDDEYTVADIYKTKASNGDVLREVKITQEVTKKDVLVEHGTDVGLGDESNVKKLKITHLAKDVAPASVEITMQIKPPSKAVAANVTGITAQFEENANASESLKLWDISVIRDSIVSQKPGGGTSDITKVLYSTNATTSSVKLYEYTDRGNQSTWKPYNYNESDARRNMQILVMQKDASGTLITGPDISNSDYAWRRNDVAIRIVHSESGVRLDTNGNPIPTNYEGVTLTEIPIFVKPENGIEIFTLSEDSQMPKSIVVGENLQTKMKGIKIRLKEYNQNVRYFTFNESGQWIEYNSLGVELNPQPSDKPNVKITTILKNGFEVPMPTSVTQDFDGSKIKLELIDKASQSHKILSEELQVRTKISEILVRGIYPVAGQLPKRSLDISDNDYASNGIVTWTDGVFDASGNFIAGISYGVKVDIVPKSGYIFDPSIIDVNKIKAKYGIDGEVSYSSAAIKPDGKLEVRFVFSSVPASPTTVISGFTPTLVPATQTATVPVVSGTSVSVSTADEFYAKVSDSNVGTIEITKNMILTKNITLYSKKVVLTKGVTVSYSDNSAPTYGKSTKAGVRNAKAVGGFRIGKGGVLIIQQGAVFNQAGKGSYKLDNGGKIINYGTMSKAGKKMIGKEGAVLKTYGNASIEITNSAEGQVMTLNGSADLIQSMSLDSNLVIGNASNLNVKPGRYLRVDAKTAITNRGTINMEDGSSIYGPGKFMGESPIGNYFGGFIGCDEDSVRYASGKTALDYSSSGSDMKLSLTVPHKTRAIYFYEVSINAGDLTTGSYQLSGTGAFSSATFEVGPPSVKTGLSSLTLGRRGLAIPSDLTPGKYTLSGVMGGANVTLEINLV